MFNYFFSLFVLFNNFKIETYLNAKKFKNLYNKKADNLDDNNNVTITINKYKNVNGYDNRNLTIPDVDIKNLSIMFYKYELLKKLESDEYNIYQKLAIINNNIIIHPFNILNGGLLEDWNFNF